MKLFLAPTGGLGGATSCMHGSLREPKRELKNASKESLNKSLKESLKIAYRESGKLKLQI